MDFCDKGTLEKYMKKNEVGFIQTITFIEKIVDAVNFMHSLEEPVIHRDLKHDNIFLKTVNGKVI